MIIAKKLLIKGLVQGVGFRPAIYRLALKHNLKGTVENNNKGVIIVIEGIEKRIENFINDLPEGIPRASNISSTEILNIDVIGFQNFKIIKSTSVSDEITEVSPDIATCDDCITDMSYQKHRIKYPFTNCTNCGPRFTIIKELPYDRPKTTMDVFPMCDTCEKEYKDIIDRRFHAQPVACNDCGPHYSLYLTSGTIDDIDHIITETAKIIARGGILAIKGMGGFHLACDAFSENAVKRLREIKNRDGKPFAVMFKDIDSAHEYFNVSNEEREVLTGWQKPVVLLKNNRALSESIGIGLDRSGVMLPYMPLHYLLFQQLSTVAIVLTSGNISDEPIVISNEEALESFTDIVDGIIIYNRDIYNRTDDSVCKVMSDIPRLIRRSRGFAPSPIEVDLNTEGIFAAGAELVNCFAIGKGNQIILSQHIGDLKNLETLQFYEESINRYFSLFRFTPELIVRDIHPDYLSSKHCEKYNIPTVSVQHHHAHIASCMAENNIDEDVIGISFDGTGLGDDDNIWGGEFFICNLEEYKRINHFEYIVQPGGDAMIKHPWRMMVSYLIHYFGEEIIDEEPWLFKDINNTELRLIVNMIKKNINCPKTSSAGRLFDSVSALLDICKNATYHAEAPMRLEAIALTDKANAYDYIINEHVSFKSTFAAMINDIKNGVAVSQISGRFHYTIAEVITDVAKNARGIYQINKVALSGGTFQNSLLFERTEKRLLEEGFDCYTHKSIPSNDGGLALGQLAIAAKRRSLNLI